MSDTKENRVIAAIRKAEPDKMRVNFFVTIEAKKALAAWCKKYGFTESSAIEAMIRDTVPVRHFGEGK